MTPPQSQQVTHSRAAAAAAVDGRSEGLPLFIFSVQVSPDRLPFPHPQYSDTVLPWLQITGNHRSPISHLACLGNKLPTLVATSSLEMGIAVYELMGYPQ